MLGAGDGWRVVEVVCRCGPDDIPFEEMHEHISVAAVLGGSFTYHSCHGRSLMAPGAILLGNHRACFRCAHDHGRGDRCVAVQVDPALAEDVAADLRGIGDVAFPGHRLAPTDGLVPLIARAHSLCDRPDAAAAEELALDFLATALRLSKDGAEASVRLRDEARVAAALAFVDSRFRDRLTLADLAAAAGVTRHHFLRVFRRTVGTTPYSYLLGRRLAAAAQALRHEGGTVLDVALASGFADLSEFTRRFRDRFGVPPAAFRKSARNAVGPRARI